ncbi:(Fe-S)-binding protein [Paenibacillus mendelii]|uniref:(Fe-S)-binding protein n=1 Tax=Paenibacillus mendelii TaxID=206163 RepID=A0ABV6JGP4_9BACL|nr:(Fe-S)-binding protein [Paenibacillus mendelii]MCQ6562498.1 (Fe-S)-binding protein [Paenibacillus mendelii]
MAQFNPFSSLDAAQLVRWILFLAVTAAAIGWFLTAIRRRVGYIRLGQVPPPRTPVELPAERAGTSGDEWLQERSRGNRAGAHGKPRLPRREASTEKGSSKRSREWAAHVFGHRKLLKDIRSGILHLVLFYGFIVLQFGAADLIWKGLTGSALPLPAYGVFLTIQEATVLLVLGAVLYGGFRRYVERLDRLKRGWKPSLVLWFIGGLMVTVLMTQAFDRLLEVKRDVAAGERGTITVVQAGSGGLGEGAPLLAEDPGRSSNPSVGNAEGRLEASGSLESGTQAAVVWKPLHLLQALEWLQAFIASNHQGSMGANIHGDRVSAPGAPVSSAIADVLLRMGVTRSAAGVGYEFFWWLHYVVLLAFLVYVPQSKHFHILSAPVNLWLRRKNPPGALAPLDLEDENAETFGVGEVEHFTQKQLLDLYACVECGRCTNVCPASNTGKLLSPMHLIMKLRDHLTEKGAAVTSKSPWAPSIAAGRQQQGAHVMSGSMPVWMEDGGVVTTIAPTMTAQRHAWNRQSGSLPSNVQLIGDVMTEEELWSCTTCRSCEEQCPVGNEHVDKIIDMRRYLVLMEGRLPAEGQRALQHIERQGNPWGLPRAQRAAWIAAYEGEGGEPVTTMQEAAKRGEQPELLLWAGTMGAFDQRSQRVLFALVRLLQHAGIPFAVLGSEERNSGDTARRMGNEMLFQTLCRENIATLSRYGIRHIVTICPHTFHAMKNEYPDFGLSGDIVVEHHTMLLDRIVAEGRLTPAYALSERIVYHDSCYLGRYNGVYDAPRRLLRTIPGVQLVEMELSRQNGMCCGAGGGLMWMEERSGARVNEARVSQALAVQPTVISSACPYCLTMMEDGVKMLAEEGGVRARDVAELLADSVFGNGSVSMGPG